MSSIMIEEGVYWLKGAINIGMIQTVDGFIIIDTGFINVKPLFLFSTTKYTKHTKVKKIMKKTEFFVSFVWFAVHFNFYKGSFPQV